MTPHHLKHDYGVTQQESWEHCRRLVSDHDIEMCNAWKAELDNLLIFVSIYLPLVIYIGLSSSFT